VPWLSWFLELNVRTYVYDNRGIPGVWFYSLACNQPLAVFLARRFFHLNYVDARMTAGKKDGWLDFQCKRLTESRYAYRSAKTFEESAPGTLNFFLTERYVLFSVDPQGCLHDGRIHHHPYRIAPAQVKRGDFHPAAEAGFRPPGREADHGLVADTLEVTAWPIQRPAN